MFLLVPAHLGCPGQNSKSRKTVVCVCVYYSCAAELLRIIRSDYLNELVDIEVNGRHLQPTKCLPW